MASWKKVHVEDANTQHGTINAQLGDVDTAIAGSTSLELVVSDGSSGGQNELKTRSITFGANAFTNTAISANQNAFSSVSPDGGVGPDAETATDDLVLSGEANVITTTGSATNTVTISIDNDAITNAKLANMTQGTIKVGGGSNAPTDLNAKTSGYILVGDGTDINSVAVSGDVTLASGGAVTIANNAVEADMLNTNVISGQTLLDVAPAGADELLLSDDGVLKRVSVTNFSAALSDDLHADNLTFTAGTTAGPVLKVVMSDASQNIDSAAFPSAASNASGIVTTGNQGFAGNKTFDNNVIVTGTLTVNGGTTTISSTNLLVEDQFIYLNDSGGGTNVNRDGGFVVEGNTKSVAFGYHQSDDRFVFDKTGATSGMTDIDPDAFFVHVHTAAGASGQDSDFAQVGNMYVNSSNDDIYIYS